MNTHGSCGRNVSTDLHMEHLNRVCKDAVAHLGANKTGAIVRIGKVVDVVSNTLSNFDKVTGVSYVSGEHTRRSDTGDLKNYSKARYLTASQTESTVPLNRYVQMCSDLSTKKNLTLG